MNGRATMTIAMHTHNMKHRTVAELGIALAQFAPRVIDQIRFTLGNKWFAPHNNSWRAAEPDQTRRRIGMVRILGQCISFAMINGGVAKLCATSMRGRSVGIVLQILTRLIEHHHKDEQYRRSNHDFGEKPVVIGSNQR